MLLSISTTLTTFDEPTIKEWYLLTHSEEDYQKQCDFKITCCGLNANAFYNYLQVLSNQTPTRIKSILNDFPESPNYTCYKVELIWRELINPTNNENTLFEGHSFILIKINNQWSYIIQAYYNHYPIKGSFMENTQVYTILYALEEMQIKNIITEDFINAYYRLSQVNISHLNNNYTYKQGEYVIDKLQLPNTYTEDALYLALMTYL